MKIDPPHSGRLIVQVRMILATRAGIWLFASRLHKIDQLALRLTSGRLTLTGLLGAVPIITLTARGARSGQLRQTPLVCIPDEDRLILIASNWGRCYHPGWYHNLKANPDVRVTYRNQSESYLAREAAGAERQAGWDKANQVYPGYEAYQRRCPSRLIPVIILTPASIQ